MSDQKTFEYLKKKVAEGGYMSLSGGERKQYSEFKKEAEKGRGEEHVETKGLAKKLEERQEEPTPDEKEDTVTIMKSDLQDMVNEGIENYKKHQPKIETKQGEWKEVVPGQKQFQTATLKLYQKDTKSPHGAIIRVD